MKLKIPISFIAFPLLTILNTQAQPTNENWVHKLDYDFVSDDLIKYLQSMKDFEKRSTLHDDFYSGGVADNQEYHSSLFGNAKVGNRKGSEMAFYE